MQKFILRFSLLLTIYLPALILTAQVSEVQILQGIQDVQQKYGLNPTDTREWVISDNYTRIQDGSSHVYLTQTINGFAIFNAQIQLHFSSSGKLIAFNNRFVSDKNTKINSSNAGITPEQALDKVLLRLKIQAEDEQTIKTTGTKPNQILLTNETVFRKPVSVILGYLPVEESLILAYKISLEPKGSNDMFVVFVNAANGEILRVNNRTLSCNFDGFHFGHFHPSYAHSHEQNWFAPLKIRANAVYNAFPTGVESPNHGSRQLLSGIEYGPASPFGWHDVNGVAGEEYTITRGNNVYAYEDQADTDQPGYSPDGGASLSFDFPLNLNNDPLTNMDAALTNLFVWNNFLHDVTYFYGFDEESGNFQANNYGNGGLDSDEVDAHGFDGSGMNNANFGTPEDGENPRMQMYLWDNTQGAFFTVNSPAQIAGTYNAGGASFGPGIPSTPITADLVLVNDGSGSPSLGCNALTNSSALNGKIAVFDRGSCTFVNKVINAQNAGAVAAIIINNQGGGANTLGGTDNGQIVIPAISLSLSDGNLIKAQMLQGPVEGTIGGVSTQTTFDSNFDNGVISHEYGHGISNRLTGGPSNVDCLFNEEQAGEGWSDFYGLVLTDRPGSSANDARGIGTFVTAEPITGPGIRPYPYSYDMNINPFTYEDIDQVSIPHGVGSVWCTMIWDLYWNLNTIYGNSYDLYSNNGGNNIAIRLVTEGLRLQACEPGFIDSRDAILEADMALYNGAHQCLIWKTFARRGLGYSADQGSSNVVGDETEAFDLPPGCDAGDVDFYANFTSTCTNTPIQFQQLVLPGASSYTWTFIGGTPSTSNSAAPTVSYSTAGTYAVTLNATNANGTASLTKQSYITISNGVDFTVITSNSQGNNSGTAGIIGLTGTPPYTYSWAQFPAETGSSITNLGPGNYSVTVTDNNGCESTENFVITDNIGLENLEKGNLIVYPNPAQSFIWVESQTPVIEISISDLSGKTIKTISCNTNKCNVPVDDLAKGMYILNIRTEGFSSQKRFVKK